MAILKGIVCEEKNGEEEITQLRSFPIRETRRRVFTAYPRFNQAAAFRFDAHTVFLLCLFCKINHRISKIGLNWISIKGGQSISTKGWSFDL